MQSHEQCLNLGEITVDEHANTLRFKKIRHHPHCLPKISEMKTFC